MIRFLTIVVIALTLIAAPIINRILVWGDPICWHSRCPAGVETSR